MFCDIRKVVLDDMENAWHVFVTRHMAAVILAVFLCREFIFIVTSLHCTLGKFDMIITVQMKFVL